jgi:hypothetical protein
MNSHGLQMRHSVPLSHHSRYYPYGVPPGVHRECTGSPVSFTGVNIVTTHDNNVYSFLSTTNTRVYLMRKSQDLARRMRLTNIDRMPVLSILYRRTAMERQQQRC